MNIVELNLNEVATIAGGAKKSAKKSVVPKTPIVLASSGSNWDWWGAAKIGGKVALAIGSLYMAHLVTKYQGTYDTHTGKFLDNFKDYLPAHHLIVQGLIFAGTYGLASFIW